MTRKRKTIPAALIAAAHLADKPQAISKQKAVTQKPINVFPIALAGISGFVLVLALSHAVNADAATQPVTKTQAEDVQTLPEVKVRAEQETASGPVQGYVIRRSAIATKTDTPLNEVAQSISVITADQVRDQNSTTMQEVLRYTAGVRSEMYGLDNRGDWFTLRGGSEGSTLLDGMRLPLSGVWGVMRNEPSAFERIEVLRGPASVIAGQNGPGGVVNLVSKRPQAEAAREVEVQFGNYGHKQVVADLTGPISTDGTLLYRLVALEKDSGNQVNHADDKRTLIAPSLVWTPIAGTRITAFAEYQKDQSGNTNAFLPYQGTLYPAPNGPISPSLFIGEPDWDRYGGDRTRFGYNLEQELNDTWILRHDFRHDHIDGKLRTMYADWFFGFADSTGASDPNGTYLNRLWYAANDKASITNADLLFEGKLKFGSTQHTVLWGADVMRNDSDNVDFGEGAATPLDVYSPVYGTFPALNWESLPSTITQTRIRNIGLLLQDQIKFDDRWALTLGIRRDRARTDSNTASPQQDSATSKNIGVVYLAGDWSPYASYSESFEPVAGTDALHSSFKPKRGKQVETGIKWSPAGKNLTATAAIYQLKEKNRLATDPANVLFSVQRGEVTVKGAEFELAAKLQAWDLIGNYTYTDAQITSTTLDDAQYQGKQLSSIPKNSAAVWGVRHFDGDGFPGLRAGLGVRYVDRTWDGLDLVSVPSYTLADALIAYERKAWRFALNVSNLTNKTYLATCLDRGDCWFGTKRRVVLTTAYRW